MRRTLLALACATVLVGGSVRADDEEKVFSGPQVGEKLTGFKVVGVFDNREGKETDFVKEASGKPLLLIFVHEVTRPSAAVTRALAGYAATRQKDGLQAYVVWLHKDRTEAAAFLKRARKSLGLKVPVGISLDGAEGPGAYGLNRKVALTILVAKDNKVTANFALVQPSVTDTPTIGEAIVKQIGGKAPELKELEGYAFGKQPARPGTPERDPKLVELLRAVIRKDATPADVTRASTEVEKYAGDDRAKLRQLGEIAALVVKLGYGTEAAQKQMKVWAEKYGPREKK
ncbi:MAG TPA: hypothetical protein VKD72_28075 [Gemmataceae bacterium]|nr:hypothetical protein [Gemmataceae bacterium]